MNITDTNTPMNPADEEHIMAAFTDLRRRAGTVPVDHGPHTQTAGGTGRGNRIGGLFGGPGGSNNRLIPALALTVIAAVAGFSAWQLLPDNDGTDDINVTTDGDLADDSDNENNSNDENTVTDDGAVQTDDSTTTTEPADNRAPGEIKPGDRLRVDAAKVAADVNDPFLNVRQQPGAGSELTAKLPPNYRGLVAGDTPTVVTDDGATWVWVSLVDPVSVNLGEPLHGGFPSGWVNAAFVIVLDDGIAVGTDEVPACTSQPDESASLGGLGGSGYVYALESGRVGSDGNCLRIVVTVAEGQAEYQFDFVPDGTGPATVLPDAFVTESGGSGVVLNLGTIDGAWPGAVDTDDGVYIVRGDDGNVDLVSPLPVGRVHVTPLAADGIIVVDLEVAGQAPPAERFVALTDAPRVSAGTVTVVGVARPFEANLGVSIIDDDGAPVAALFSGSASLGTLRGTEYGVQTNDWTEAWGRFAVTASDLQPGSYTMLLDGEGGVDVPTRTSVPFTITEAPSGESNEPSADEQAAAQALVGFAQGGTATDLNLADEVTLSLGITHQETFTRAQLADRDNWSLDFEPFAGRVGPFNPLDVLIDGQVQFRGGTIPHCASPALDWPTEWDALTQINIEPVAATSCLEWYAVSLFRNSSGQVEVIVLDLYEP